jgi:pyruvate kinase
VNLPGVVVDLPTLTEKDVDDITNWAVPNEIDFIAASFVRKGSDIDTIRQVCRGVWVGTQAGHIVPRGGGGIRARWCGRWNWPACFPHVSL